MKAKKLILTIFVLLSVTILGILGVVWYSGYKNRKAEKIIDQRFHQEVSRLVNVSVNYFLLWEGDSMASLKISNKGEVDFWYGADGVPRISRINEFRTDYKCFYVNDSKMEYAYDLPLDLSSDGKFGKWFKFKVNSISDLVEKFDLITQTLKAFPKYKLKTAFEYNWLERKQIEDPDMNFILIDKHSGKDVWCDLRQ